MQNEAEKYPVFRDEGRYLVIDGGAIEEGSWVVDTRVASQSAGWDWEIGYSKTPDGIGPSRLFPTTTIDYEKLNIWRLWSPEEDPNGERAEKIHRRVVDLLKCNVDSNDFDILVIRSIEESFS